MKRKFVDKNVLSKDELKQNIKEVDFRFLVNPKTTAFASIKSTSMELGYPSFLVKSMYNAIEKIKSTEYEELKLKCHNMLSISTIHKMIIPHFFYSLLQRIRAIETADRIFEEKKNLSVDIIDIINEYSKFKNIYLSFQSDGNYLLEDCHRIAYKSMNYINRTFSSDPRFYASELKKIITEAGVVELTFQTYDSHDYYDSCGTNAKDSDSSDCEHDVTIFYKQIFD